ncbi:hypothetical protein EI94DRAFT_1699745 [Lactarius quietus]|nr:hypothetical protein EI94DRAFT_1699745 [Lactarius quietus]
MWQTEEAQGHDNQGSESSDLVGKGAALNEKCPSAPDSKLNAPMSGNPDQESLNPCIVCGSASGDGSEEAYKIDPNDSGKDSVTDEEDSVHTDSRLEESIQKGRKQKQKNVSHSCGKKKKTKIPAASGRKTKPGPNHVKNEDVNSEDSDEEVWHVKCAPCWYCCHNAAATIVVVLQAVEVIVLLSGWACSCIGVTQLGSTLGSHAIELVAQGILRACVIGG